MVGIQPPYLHPFHCWADSSYVSGITLLVRNVGFRRPCDGSTVMRVITRFTVGQ